MSPKPNGNSSKKKPTNSLVALGSVAVLGVYAAGYAHTAAAAARFSGDVAVRRSVTTIAHAAGAQMINAQSAVDNTTSAIAPTPSAQPAPTASSSPDEKPKVRAGKPAAVTATTVAVDTVAVSKAQAPVSVFAPSAIVGAVPAKGVAGKTASDSAAAVADNNAAPQAAKAAQPSYKDGTYIGWGTSQHGDVEATVEVRAGKIISASISVCRTEYSCSWIAALPPQVVARQSPEVDYVSGATHSTNAFYSAVVQALSQAK